jgi:hypothetical protein
MKFISRILRKYNILNMSGTVIAIHKIVYDSAIKTDEQKLNVPNTIFMKQETAEKP